MSGRTKGGKRLHKGGTKRHKENRGVITKPAQTFPREKSNRSTLADKTNDDLSPSATKLHSISTALLLLLILQYFKHTETQRNKVYTHSC